MPDKTVPLLFAALGALVALVGLALWIDVRRAAGRGPAWRRRLLTAGLLLLAGLGIFPKSAWAGPAAVQAEGQAKAGLAAEPAWQDLEKVWADAAAVASGSRGSFPFDRAGKEKLLADLKRVRDSVAQLVERGLLSDPEGKLLVSDLDRLSSGVGRFRPTEMKMATCYKPMMYREGQKTLTWMEGRLPLLEKMAREKWLKPAVVDKVLARFEADLAILSDPQASHDLDPAQRKKAKGLITRAKRSMATIRKTIAR